MQPTLAYTDTQEQIATECAECFCSECGSTKLTVILDAEVLGISDPICCEVAL